MKNSSIELKDAIDTARLLGIFKDICMNNLDVASKSRLRNILYNSSNKVEMIKKMVANNYNETLDDMDCKKLIELIEAFLNKMSFRKIIHKSVKEDLLLKQENKCAICNCDIDITAHADHIVPFKYVGDELENNLQMLCRDCNEKKKTSLDYQIRYLLKLL